MLGQKEFTQPVDLPFDRWIVEEFARRKRRTVEQIVRALGLLFNQTQITEEQLLGPSRQMVVATVAHPLLVTGFDHPLRLQRETVGVQLGLETEGDTAVEIFQPVVRSDQIHQSAFEYKSSHDRRSLLSPPSSGQALLHSCS